MENQLLPCCLSTVPELQNLIIRVIHALKLVNGYQMRALILVTCGSR